MENKTIFARLNSAPYTRCYNSRYLLQYLCKIWSLKITDTVNLA